MATSESNQQLQVLNEIRDIHKQQLANQTEALAIQKQQFELYKQQFEKASKLQDRAEAIQESSKALVDKSRRLFAIILPIIFVLIAYLSWLMFT